MFTFLINWADFLLKLPKFIGVGGIGFGLDLGTTWLLKEKLKLKKYTANSIGFAIGIAFRYVLNRIWTFESNNPNILFEIISFAIIALIGLGIVNGIIYLLTEKKKWTFYKAKIASMIVFFMWNYSANYFFTFSGIF